MTDGHAHFTIDLDNTPVIECTVRAWRFDGHVYPERAWTWLIEIAPKHFALVPFWMKGDDGYLVRWKTPFPGGQIETPTSITSPSDAHRAFAAWAQRTYADRQESTAMRASRLLREASEETWARDQREGAERPKQLNTIPTDLRQQIEQLNSGIAALDEILGA